MNSTLQPNRYSAVPAETPAPVISRDCLDSALSPLSKRQRSSQDIFNQTDDSTSRNYQSQPMPQMPADLNDGNDRGPYGYGSTGRFGNGNNAGGGAGGGGRGGSDIGGGDGFGRNGFCFSQPAMLDDLILCTQLNSTQSASQNLFQKLVRRMTRFFVSTSFEESIRRVTASVAKLSYTSRVNDEGVVSVTGQFAGGIRCRSNNGSYVPAHRSQFRPSIGENCSWCSKRTLSKWTAKYCSTFGCRRAADWSLSDDSSRSNISWLMWW